MSKFKYKNENGEWIEVANKADIPTQPSDIGAQPEGDYIIDPNYTHTDNNFTTLLKNAYDSAVNWITTNGANILNHIADSVKHVTAQNKADWDSKQPAGDYATNTALATKVDKVTGKSLIADTEITKLGAYPNIPATPEGKILSDNGAFIPISAGATDTAANLYASNINSATSGYKELSYQVDVAQVTKTITTTAQNVIAYGEKYLFASQYGEALINSGQWQLHATGFVDSATGVSRMVLRIFKYSIGGVETELFVKQGEEINNTTAATMLVDYESPNITVLATDRIGFQIGFVTTSVVARTLSFYVGDGDAVHISAPFSARHSRLRAKNEETAFQHVDLTSTKTTLIADDKLVIFDSETNTAKLADRKAANIPFTPAGNIAATNVDGALKELDGKKASKSESNTFTGIQTLTDGTKLTKIVPQSDASGVVIRNAADDTDVASISTDNGITARKIVVNNYGSGSRIEIIYNGVIAGEFANNAYACVIGSPSGGGQSLLFQTNGINRGVFANSTGYFGVNITIPETILDINGTTTLRDWTYLNNGIHDGDAIGDRRFKVFNGVEVTERCTVANATKGAGTWINASGQVGDNTNAASADLVGSTRYREDSNNSYVEMCMRTGASTYAWVEIVKHNW